MLIDWFSKDLYLTNSPNIKGRSPYETEKLCTYNSGKCSPHSDLKPDSSKAGVLVKTSALQTAASLESTAAGSPSDRGLCVGECVFV